MVEKRAYGFRRGDLAEGLGQMILRCIAAVAPVPREEDFGMDAVCTLLRREGRTLHAEDTFTVQLKAAASGREQHLKPHHVRWLQELDVPLLWGLVDLQSGSLDLYGMHNVLVHAATFNAADDGMTICVDNPNPDPQLVQHWLVRPEVRGDPFKCWLGEPLVSTSISRIVETAEAKRFYDLLKPWMGAYAFQRRLKEYGVNASLRKWQGQIVLAGRISGSEDPRPVVRLCQEIELLLERLWAVSGGIGHPLPEHRAIPVVANLAREIGTATRNQSGTEPAVQFPEFWSSAMYSVIGSPDWEDRLVQLEARLLREDGDGSG